MTKPPLFRASRLRLAVWYAWRDRKLYVVGRERAVWVQFLRSEPRVGVMIDEEARRHRRVQMTALAAVIEGPVLRAGGSPLWQQLDEVLVSRYMSDAAGAAYRAQTADRLRYLVELTPVQITTWSGGDWHPRYVHTEAASLPPTAIVEV